MAENPTSLLVLEPKPRVMYELSVLSFVKVLRSSLHVRVSVKEPDLCTRIQSNCSAHCTMY